MIKFLTGSDLITEIDSIIWDAKQKLVLISPFIRLDTHFKEKLLSQHLQNEKVHILVVFGKNETDVSRSLNKEDFEFLKKFPFISIIYEPTLHAKYYSNEHKGIITSINLHDHSFKNNIEYGVLAEKSITDKLLPTTNIDMKAWDKSLEIAYNGTVVFINRPKIQRKMLGMVTSYLGSEVMHDSTEAFYGKKTQNVTNKKKLGDFPDEIPFGLVNKQTMPTRETPIREEVNQKVKQDDWRNVKTGYCIRTREEIPFDPARPFSYNAYKEWENFGNWEYGEKYCHLTGEKSNRQTSRLKPILNSEYRNKVERMVRQNH